MTFFPLTLIDFRAFTGNLDNNFKTGIYSCVVCSEDLFSSGTKYDSGCGWPAFFDSLDKSKFNFKPCYKKGKQKKYTHISINSN